MIKHFLKIFKISVITLGLLYVILCAFFYSLSGKVLFNPKKLDANFHYHFEKPFEEINIKTPDGKLLNSLLFKVEKPKGAVLYFHGNSGNINGWSYLAPIYNNLNYDLFITDYRGFGKSEGTIESETQIYNDLQLIYNKVKERYSEDKIVLIGYSIGSGLAAKIASENNPKLLILQAPYYNIPDLIHSNVEKSDSWLHKLVKICPPFVYKLKFKTNEFLPKCNMPVTIFHGDKDELIYYGSALKLQKLFKPEDKLITLKEHGHEGVNNNKIFQSELENLLE